MKTEMKYSLDKSVVFNSDNHTYIKNGKYLISVTSFISQFKNEFDSDFWSKKIAIREGKSQDQILTEWKEKAKKSREIGTAVHKIFEEYINGNFCIVSGDIHIDFVDLELEYISDFLPKAKNAIQFIKDFFITKRLIPIHSEFIVYNDKLAGQVDLICQDKKGNFYILDFKTNEKIETNAYGKSLKGLFYKVPDSVFNHYSLQLSIYKKMFSEKVNKLYLVHICNKKYKIIECDDIFEKFSIEFESALI